MREYTDAYPRRRQSDANVVFELLDLDAAESVLNVLGNECAISKKNQTHNRIYNPTYKLATCEPEQFLLDGSFTLPRGNENGEIGFWSELLSNENGEFGEAQGYGVTLIINFSGLHKSAGTTVVFDPNEYCEKLAVLAMKDGDIVFQRFITGNTSHIVKVEESFTGYNKIQIFCQKTSKPLRRVRITEVALGLVETFEKDDLVSVNMVTEMSHDSSNLPSGELRVKFKNTDKRYNFLNTKGIYQYLERGQRVNVSLGVGKEKDPQMLPFNQFFYTTSSTEDDTMTAEIVANDKFSMLEDSIFRKGKIGTIGLEQLLKTIISDSKTKLGLKVANNIKSKRISSAVPVVSHREAIRLAVQAAQAICYINYNNELIVAKRRPKSTVHETLNKNNCYEYPKININEYTNTIEVKATEISGTFENHAELYKATVRVNGTKEIWCDYNNVAKDVTASVTSGTLVSASYYAFSCKLKITGSGGVGINISGKQGELINYVETIADINIDEEHILTVDNGLVLKADVEAFGKWMLSNAKNRIEYSMKTRGNPANEMVDNMKVFDNFGENKVATLEQQRLTYDGTLEADVTLRGGE